MTPAALKMLAEEILLLSNKTTKPWMNGGEDFRRWDRDRKLAHYTELRDKAHALASEVVEAVERLEARR